MERNFDNFDEFAENYREIHNKNIKISGTDTNYFSEYKIIEVSKHEKGNTVNKILDLGCGDGNSVVYMRKYFQNSSIDGVDVSSKSIAVAQNRKIPNTFFQSYDGQHLPFENSVFDVIFIAGVLHHVDKKYHSQILRECYRTLKPGGRLYIFEHNPLNPVTRSIVKDCVFDHDAVLVRSAELENKIMQTKFKSVKTRFTIFFPRSKLFKFFVKLEKYLAWLPLGGQYYVLSVK